MKEIDIVKMFGKYVKVIPKQGDPIEGLFVGEKRLYEYTKDIIFVIQIGVGLHAFISRDNVSYILVSDSGIVSDRALPEYLSDVFEGYK